MALSRTSLIGSASSGNHGTGSFSSGSFTPPNNSLIVAFVYGQAWPGSVPSAASPFSCTGGSLTWTRRLIVTTASNGWPSQMEIWTAPVTTGSSMTITVDHASATMGGWLIHAVAYTGYDTSTPTGATASSASLATDGAATITLSGSPASDSEVLAGRLLQMDTAGGCSATQGSGWTELYDASVNDWASAETQVRGGSTSTSVAWADVNGNGAAIATSIAGAIEIKAASSGVSLTATGIATGAPSVGSPAITQKHALTATGVATGAPPVGAPTLHQVHDLDADGVATDAPSVGEPDLAQTFALSADGIATDAPSTGEPDLAQVHGLAAEGVDTGAPSVGEPDIAQVHVLTAEDLATGEPSVGEPALTGPGTDALGADGIATGAPTVGSPALSVEGEPEQPTAGPGPAGGTPARRRKKGWRNLQPWESEPDRAAPSHRHAVYPGRTNDEARAGRDSEPEREQSEATPPVTPPAAVPAPVLAGLLEALAPGLPVIPAGMSDQDIALIRRRAIEDAEDEIALALILELAA